MNFAGARFDYVIVGAGSAGAVLAARLSENADRKVLLIEAGGGDRSLRIQIPGFVEDAITSPRWNWHYRGEPDPSLGGRRLTWAAGRVLGGSSSINGMVYGRGLPADYDRWVAAGCEGWGWDDLLPSFCRLEHWTGAPHPSRGTGGPLNVRRFEETDPSCASAMEALVRLGVPAVDDYSTGICEGVGLTQATQRNGLRHSVSSAYLHPARRRSNLTVLTGRLVHSLIVEGGRCRGVRVRNGRALTAVFAERETIVSAGAFGSPKLLMLSGIGPADDLSAHGIRVVHDLRGVGRHLNDHVNVLLCAFVDRPTYNTQRHGWSAIRHGARFLYDRSGPVGSPANHCQAFVRTDKAQASADVQIQLMPVGFGSGAQMRRNGMTAVVSVCHPQARGRVLLRSSDPADPPRIRISLLEEATDRASLIRGCRLAEAALRDGPGRTVKGQIYAPAGRMVSDLDWLAFMRETAALNWHPTSTCRMGGGPEDVVGLDLKVHGLESLSVVDASVMPFVTSANTNIPVIAIAERSAAIIAGRTC